MDKMNDKNLLKNLEFPRDNLIAVVAILETEILIITVMVNWSLK